MNHFANCTTVADIKKRYRELCFLHHPDIGGNTRTMQTINDQYHAALKHADNTDQLGTDGKTRTYTYNPETEQAIIDKMTELINLNLTECTIYLVGYWLWIRGDTRPHKEALKLAGCKWHSKRRCWYWHKGEYKHFRSRSDFATLAAAFGAQVVAEAPRKPATPAALP